MWAVLVTNPYDEKAWELAEQIINLVQRGPSGKGGTYIPYQGDLRPLLSAALAACAREGRLKEAKIIDAEFDITKEPTMMNAWRIARQIVKKRVAALDQAAGGKEKG